MKTKLRRLEEDNNRKDKQIEQLLDPFRVTISWGDKNGAKECWAVWSSSPCFSRFQESVVCLLWEGWTWIWEVVAWCKGISGLSVSGHQFSFKERSWHDMQIHLFSKSLLDSKDKIKMLSLYSPFLWVFCLRLERGHLLARWLMHVVLRPELGSNRWAFLSDSWAWAAFRVIEDLNFTEFIVAVTFCVQLCILGEVC